MKVQGVQVLDVIQGVKIISICDWLEIAFGKKWHMADQKDVCRQLKIWCAVNDATYYAAPHEDFYFADAVDKAKEKGKSVVVVEDLS